MLEEHGLVVVVVEGPPAIPRETRFALVLQVQLIKDLLAEMAGRVPGLARAVVAVGRGRRALLLLVQASEALGVTVYNLALLERLLIAQVVVVVHQRVPARLVARLAAWAEAGVQQSVLTSLYVLLENEIPAVGAVAAGLLPVRRVLVVLVLLSFVTKSRRQYGALRTSY
jgi:hypothetical protein